MIAECLGSIYAAMNQNKGGALGSEFGYWHWQILHGILKVSKNLKCPNFTGKLNANLASTKENARLNQCLVQLGSISVRDAARDWVQFPSAFCFVFNIVDVGR
jgi:hypothetical protein